MKKNRNARRVVIYILLSICILVVCAFVLMTKNTIGAGLPDGEKSAMVFNRIYEELESENMNIILSVDSDECLNNAIEMIYDCPEFFWIDRNYKIVSISNLRYIQFSIYYNDYYRMNEEIGQITDDILEGLPVNASEYDIVKYVHDTLCERITYGSTGDEVDHNIYGALVNNKCVCEGYAKAFSYLLNKAGMKVLYFSGTSMIEGTSYPHSWNGVYIEDELYYFDLTWDDYYNEYYSYGEFAVTSVEINRNHTFDDYHPMIEADSKKYNYHEYNGYVLYEYNIENLKEIIGKQGDIIDIKCTSVTDYNKLVALISDLYSMNSLFVETKENYKGINCYTYSVYEDTYCVRLFINK